MAARADCSLHLLPPEVNRTVLRELLFPLACLFQVGMFHLVITSEPKLQAPIFKERWTLVRVGLFKKYVWHCFRKGVFEERWSHISVVAHLGGLIRVLSCQDGLSSGSFLIWVVLLGCSHIRVVFQQGVLTSVWSFNRVFSHQFGLSSVWSLVSLVFHQGGLSSVWSFIRMVSHQGGLLSVWSFIRVVSHQFGLSSGWSLIRVST